MSAPRPLLRHERVTIFGGDSAELDLPEDSVDAIVTDPPAAISFMGRAWDDDRGGYDGWTRWLASALAPSVRALRPGGHALLWALPRTSHWTARAAELAGLEIRDVHHDAIAAEEIFAELAGALDDRQRALVARALECIHAPIFYHAFGSGFPKSLDLSKALDAAAGASRSVIGPSARHVSCKPEQRTAGLAGSSTFAESIGMGAFITAPATAGAARWAGYGTALKPAVEHWILARKPLAGTYAANVLRHGVGALNIDACRIGTAAGRWPAHFSLRHAPGCRIVGLAGEVARAVYACAPGCPAAELDAQSGCLRSGKHEPHHKRAASGGNGVTHGQMAGVTGEGYLDVGGASRFFYCAKPSRNEKDAGLDHIARTGGAKNHHPTAKGIELMRWLITLVVPGRDQLGRPGVVLDPFAGSGTTGTAALELGHAFIGCELGGDGGEYWPILVGRIRHALRSARSAS